VLHCFSGKKKFIRRATELGYVFSVPTNIKKSQHFQMLVEMVPLSQILTETDAPYLSPVGFPNEPANVRYTIQKIAEIKEMDAVEVANIIYQNFQRLFL
jgi:TatD DNase family protein